MAKAKFDKESVELKAEAHARLERVVALAKSMRDVGVSITEIHGIPTLTLNPEALEMLLGLPFGSTVDPKFRRG